MNTPARPFKDITKIRAAVDAIAKKDDVPTVVFPSALAKDSTQPATESAAAAPVETISPRKPRLVKKERARNIRTGVDLPDYVKIAIAKMALDEKVTNRFLHLKALRAIGIAVNDVDFEEDGRRGK